MTRYFISLPVGEQVKKEIISNQKEILGLYHEAKIKLTDLDKMHVTLAFLGEITPQQIEKVKSILSAIVAKHGAFAFKLDHPQCVPSVFNPAVIVDTLKEDEEGDLLQEHLIRALRKAGVIKKDVKWHPHVTLGRIVKAGSVPLKLAKLHLKKISWIVDKVEFIESHLQPSGATFNSLGEYQLRHQ